MSKHTPGPWKANFAIEGAAYIFGGDRNFARVFNEWQDEANQEANARLIAASPDLLRVMDLVASGLEADGRTLDGMTKAVAAVKLRAAIAKATGEQA